MLLTEIQDTLNFLASKGVQDTYYSSDKKQRNKGNIRKELVPPSSPVQIKRESSIQLSLFN